MTAESLLPIVELLPGPALLVGPGGKVVGANESAGRWFGPGRDRMGGRPLAEIVADPPERVAGFLEACARGGGKVAGSLTPALSGGNGAGGPCRVEGIAVPARPGGDGPALIVVHVIPGEPGGDRATELEALREEVHRRDEFLDRLAHDLRNPVAALSGAFHLARKATVTEDVAWAEEAMERQIKHLVRQLDDLLDLARLSHGKIELNRQRLDAAAAARAATLAARPLIDERNHRLTLATSPGDLTVVADPARLEQVLVGLLSHVAGSTEPGSCVRLAIARERDAIVFRVRDRGEDASAATLPEVPDRPAPGDPAAEESSIELMLIRKLAELHGGAASFRSASPGAAREFTVRLPAPGSTATEAAPAAGTHPDVPDGARVLVVDDNVDAARGVARLLQLAGYDVRVAHDGYEALEIAHDHQPRFILLDIGMPGMDGYEVARRLRGDPRHRDATIIAISGYSEDDYQPPQEVGLDHHLVKPIDYSTLRAILGQ